MNYAVGFFGMLFMILAATCFGMLVDDILSKRWFYAVLAGFMTALVFSVSCVFFGMAFK